MFYDNYKFVIITN